MLAEEEVAAEVRLGEVSALRVPLVEAVGLRDALCPHSRSPAQVAVVVEVVAVLVGVEVMAVEANLHVGLLVPLRLVRFYLRAWKLGMMNYRFPTSFFYSTIKWF